MNIYKDIQRLNDKCDRLAASMGLSVGRVEFSPSQTEVEELRAEVAMLRGEREILRRERDKAREQIKGWELKWKCAVEMAALAQNKLEAAK